MGTRALQIGKTDSDRRRATQAIREETLGSAERELPNDAHGLIAGLVGARKHVLDVGCGSGVLARLLANRQCDIVGIDRDPLAVEEARRVCTHAYVADLDHTALSEIATDRPFDAIVFSDVVGQLREPLRVLDECRALLTDGGILVASFSNIAHGALRLALFAGTYDHHDAAFPGQMRSRLYSAKSVEELFVSAGYKIDRMERTTAPIDSGDLPADVVAQVQSDPECGTLEFVVCAVALSNEAKYRAITKRFLVVNSELGATKQTLARKERELERLREQLEAAAHAPSAVAQPVSLGRERRLVDGLRRSLDEAVVQYDRGIARERKLQRLLDEMTASRDEVVAKYKGMFGVLNSAQAERDAAKAQLAGAHAELAALADDRAATAELRTQLQARVKRVEDLQIELQGLNARITEAAREHDALAARLAASGVTAAKLESELVASWESLEHAERERAELRAVVAAEAERTRSLCEGLEGKVTAAVTEAANERQWREKIEAKFLAARAEVERVAAAYAAEKREVGELQARLRFTEARLAEQIEALALSAETECQRLAGLIDTVQAGFFWRMKGLLGRMKGRVRA